MGGGQSAAQAHAAISRGCEGSPAAALVGLGPAAESSWLRLGWKGRRQRSASPRLCSPMNKRFLRRKGPGAACPCKAKAGALEGAGPLLPAWDWRTGWEEAAAGLLGDSAHQLILLLLLHRVQSSRSFIFPHLRAFETPGRSDLLTGLNTAGEPSCLASAPPSPPAR